MAKVKIVRPVITAAKIKKAAKASDSAVEAAKKRFENNINKFFDTFIAKVQRTIRKASDINETTGLTLSTASKLALDMNKILVESGYNDVLAEFTASYPAIAKGSLEYFASIGAEASLSAVDVSALDAFISFTETRLDHIIDLKLLYPIQEGLFAGAFGGATREELYAQIDALADNLSSKQVEQLVDESFSAFERGVTAEKAKELDLEIYQYEGPDDAITSEQCSEILNGSPHGVPGMYYVDEINVDMAEGLVYDPLIYGGHPNCRHRWLPVTTEYAIEQGFEVEE